MSMNSKFNKILCRLCSFCVVCMSTAIQKI